MTRPAPAPGRRDALRHVARLLVLALLCTAPAASQTTDEAQVHAAYVINFLRYTRWPDESPAAPRVVAVVGAGAPSTVLRELAARASAVDGRAVVVRVLGFNAVAPSRDEAVRTLRPRLDGAHVVYVAPSHAAWEAAVIEAARGRPLLTVGTAPGFARRGGMFELFLEQGSVRFAANTEAMRGAQLDVSARVLLLARTRGGGR